MVVRNVYVLFFYFLIGDLRIGRSPLWLLRNMSIYPHARLIWVLRDTEIFDKHIPKGATAWMLCNGSGFHSPSFEEAAKKRGPSTETDFSKSCLKQRTQNRYYHLLLCNTNVSEPRPFFLLFNSLLPFFQLLLLVKDGKYFIDV